MAEQVDGALLRKVAKSIEDAAQADLRDYGDLALVPVIGDMQYFPRAAPEARAAQTGFRLLRERIDEVVAMLYALAEGAERNPPLLQSPLLILVNPYVDAYRVQQQQKNGADNDSRPVKEGPDKRDAK